MFGSSSENFIQETYKFSARRNQKKITETARFVDGSINYYYVCD